LTATTIHLDLPDALYRRLERRAQRAQRTVAEELLDVVAAALPQLESMPAGFQDELEALRLLEDADLWQVARSRLSEDGAAELERLTLEQQRDGLTAPERERLRALLSQYEHAMLMRAEAAALLAGRGLDVSSLLPSE